MKKSNEKDNDKDINLKGKSSKELQKKNKFIYLGLSLIVLILSITGATYAYFALTATNNSTITGTVGGATLSLTVTKSFPTTTTSMVPQLESTLGEAISTTYSCVDGNSNVVCQVYKAVIKNTGTTSAELTGTISFQNIDTLPNLKWKLIPEERTIGEATGTVATTSEQAFETKKIFAPNEAATYYFVIWIDEIGEVQTDRGTFRATINFKPTNGTGITSTIVPEPLKLSKVEPGSYVAYTGTNGCTGASCTGQNANYVDDTNMGYCNHSSYKFSVNGWRVVYVANETAYLVSAGSPECVCTNSDGSTSSNSCGSASTPDEHINNLNNIALKYCNPEYAYGGVCDSTNSWNMNQSDILNIDLSMNFPECMANANENGACPRDDDRINNSGLYWFADYYHGDDIFVWDQDSLYHQTSNFVYGIRPILRLKPNVLVTGGSGTYEDPYQISVGS